MIHRRRLPSALIASCALLFSLPWALSAELDAGRGKTPDPIHLKSTPTGPQHVPKVDPGAHNAGIPPLPAAAPKPAKEATPKAEAPGPDKAPEKGDAPAAGRPQAKEQLAGAIPTNPADVMAAKDDLDAGFTDSAKKEGSLPTPGASFHDGAARLSGELTFAQLAQLLAKDPRAIETLAGEIRSKLGQTGKGWPSLGDLSNVSKERLISALRNADKSFLDSFPTMTLPELKLFILEYGKAQGPVDDAPTGPSVEKLDLPGAPKIAPKEAVLKDLGDGLFRGDRPMTGLPSAYGDNVRMSAVLNRLSLNEPGKPAAYAVMLNGKKVISVEGLLKEFLKTGHKVTAKDIRVFANFGHLLYRDKGRLWPVATPLYVDTGVTLPSGRKLTVPASHSHLQLEVRGPKVNLDLIFYFGVAGTVAFHPLDTWDQPWVNGRSAHEWQGTEAVKFAARAALVRRELRIKAKKHGLPFGGYGPLGVCDDIEALVTGAPIYPLVRDPRYYNDGQTIDAWAKNLPVDGVSAPDPRRILDSLPVGDPDQLLLPQVRELLRELKSWLEKKP